MNDTEWVIATGYDCGLKLTVEQATEILADPQVKATFAAGGQDTVTRESIAEFLGKKITGKPWPTYGNTPEQREAFWADYETKAAACGYTLTD
jgi:hypothetical protein